MKRILEIFTSLCAYLFLIILDIIIIETLKDSFFE